MNGNPSRANAEPPISIDELSSTLEESAVLRFACRFWHALSAAPSTSVVIGAAVRAGSTLPTVESRLLVGAYVLAVAMVTHLALMAFAERYAFPGYSRYWLPSVLLVIAVVLIALRAPIAAAWRERRTRA